MKLDELADGFEEDETLDEILAEQEKEEEYRYWKDMEDEYLQNETEELKQEIRKLKRRKTKTG
jgi:hypothetical protein